MMRDITKWTQEFFDDFAGYVLQAKTWAKILDLVDPNKFGTVIDLCPGWSPKIPMALWLVNFHGRLVMADKDTTGAEHIAEFMQFFGPRYSAENACIDLFKPIDIKSPLVLANHIIDDLVLALAKDWEDEGSVRWQGILGRRELAIAEAVPLVCNIFEQTVMPEGRAVITHYRSYTDRIMGLDEPLQLCRHILEEAVHKLCSSGFVRDRILPQKALDGFNGYFGADDCAVLTRT